MGRLTGTVIDCSHPPGAARFWSRMLGWQITQAHDSLAVVSDPDGVESLTFRHREHFVERVPEPAPGADGDEQEPERNHSERDPSERAHSEPGGVRRLDLSGMLRLPSDPRPGRQPRPARGVGFRVGVSDVARATDEALRLGAIQTSDLSAEPGTLRDPSGVRFTLVADPDAGPVTSTSMPDIRRYVAIGDSTTEGLVDTDGHGGWRGWADRLAAHIANASDHPVEYANLAISGYRLSEIADQLEPALAMEPDLMTIVGGVNDILGLRPHFQSMENQLDELFAAPRERGIRVLSFTMPDISRANPVATVVRDRILTLNQIIRRCALRHDVALIDFEHVPSASDPRLWGEDRLHINSIGHIRVAAAMAWLIGIPDADRSWMDDLQPTGPSEIGPLLQWGLKHFGPWVVQGMRGPQYRQGSECKRPQARVIEVQQDPRVHG